MQKKHTAYLISSIPAFASVGKMKLVQVAGFNLPSTAGADSAMRCLFVFIVRGELKLASSTFRAPKLNPAHEETPFKFFS